MTDFQIGYPKTELNPKRRPLPTQDKFHNSTAKYRLLAGGFGTGKSTTLALEVLRQLFKHKNNYGVLGRKDLGELRSTTLKELLDICPPLLIRNHNKQDKIISFLNGSELYYMNLDDSRDAVEKIKSLNLGFVAIDQLEELTEDVFLAFQGRLRRQNTSRNFFATSNPAGHDWVYRRWKTKESLNDDVKHDYELFESITLENKYLPEDYVKQLLSYPDKWVKRFVYCDWADFEGLVYSEFNEKLNTETIYTPTEAQNHFITIDYGFRNPTAILFAAVDFDGIIHIYQEFYESGKLIPELVNAIKGNKYHHKATILIDPSTQNVQRDAKSIIQEFGENGIYPVPADNNVMQGIDRVNQMFKDQRLVISKNCENFFKEIGNYKWKEIKPGQTRNEYEEPIKHNDHLMDALRYMVNYVYTPIDKTDNSPKWLRKMKEQNGSKSWASI